MIVFNVYYSTNRSGPWTLANETPIEFNESGNHSYVITGLSRNVIYYIAVVGGILNNANEFEPLLNQQDIGPFSQGAGGVEVSKDIKSARTFSPV